jgi:hypothetical protein
MTTFRKYVFFVGVLLFAFVVYTYSVKTGRPWKAVSSDVTIKAYLYEVQYHRTCDPPFLRVNIVTTFFQMAELVGWA